MCDNDEAAIGRTSRDHPLHGLAVFRDLHVLAELARTHCHLRYRQRIRVNSHVQAHMDERAR
jgi:hypothetical protein